MNAEAGIVGKQKFSKKQVVALWAKGYRQGCLETSRRYAEAGISAQDDGIKSGTNPPTIEDRT